MSPKPKKEKFELLKESAMSYLTTDHMAYAIYRDLVKSTDTGYEWSRGPSELRAIDHAFKVGAGLMAIAADRYRELRGELDLAVKGDEKRIWINGEAFDVVLKRDTEHDAPKWLKPEKPEDFPNDPDDPAETVAEMPPPGHPENPDEMPESRSQGRSEFEDPPAETRGFHEEDFRAMQERMLAVPPKEKGALDRWVDEWEGER